MPLALKRRFTRKKKLTSSNEKDEASALMRCPTQHFEDESISHSIMVMCSPFHYKTKQYRHLRLILMEYIEYIKRVLAIVHPVSSSSYMENDQLVDLCSMMRDQLDRIKHAFRKVSACRHDVDYFYHNQWHVLDQSNWARMEHTLALLCTTLPVENDYLCPICLQILTRPMVLNECHHRFCEKCLDDYFSLGLKRDLTDPPAHCFPCPVCRALVTQCQPDQALSNFLALYFPVHKPWWSALSSIMKSVYVAWCATSCSYCYATVTTMDDVYMQGQIYMSAWY